jgi:hypothetical protein
MYVCDTSVNGGEHIAHLSETRRYSDAEKEFHQASE